MIARLPTAKESKERVRSAIKNAGFEFPGDRITVNLAPADVRKEASSFDLPVAVGILAVMKATKPESLRGDCGGAFAGRAYKTPSRRPYHDDSCREEKIGTVIVPTGNGAEAAIIRDHPQYHRPWGRLLLEIFLFQGRGQAEEI